MAVIAVINRKGGSGKSTLATHLATYCASTGSSVMLGDVDKQQSTQTWLRLRKTQPGALGGAIVGWHVEPSAFARPPAGIDHVIFDTPGGLRGFDLARIVMYADAIIMPVCNSIFDRESAADCLAELRTLPRIANGRCRVGAVGMRVDSRTRGADALQAWAEQNKLPFIAVLRESQAYVRCIEQGLSLFDLPPAQVQSDLEQWKPILRWLKPVLEPAPAVEAARTAREAIPECVQAVPASRAPGAAATKPGRPVLARPPSPAARPATVQRQALPPPVLQPARAPGTSTVSRLLGALPSLAIPRFLQR